MPRRFMVRLTYASVEVSRDGQVKIPGYYYLYETLTPDDAPWFRSVWRARRKALSCVSARPASRYPHDHYTADRSIGNHRKGDAFGAFHLQVALDVVRVTKTQTGGRRVVSLNDCVPVETVWLLPGLDADAYSEMMREIEVQKDLAKKGPDEGPSVVRQLQQSAAGLVATAASDHIARVIRREQALIARAAEEAELAKAARKALSGYTNELITRADVPPPRLVLPDEE